MQSLSLSYLYSPTFRSNPYSTPQTVYLVQIYQTRRKRRKRGRREAKRNEHALPDPTLVSAQHAHTHTFFLSNYPFIRSFLNVCDVHIYIYMRKRERESESEREREREEKRPKKEVDDLRTGENNPPPPPTPWHGRPCGIKRRRHR